MTIIGQAAQDEDENIWAEAEEAREEADALQEKADEAHKKADALYENVTDLLRQAEEAQEEDSAFARGYKAGYEAARQQYIDEGSL